MSIGENGRFLLGLAFGLLLLWLTAPVSAAMIRVPVDQPTIQAGIDAAVSGDTVLVADGTYTGVGNRDMSFLSKNIIVRSENGSNNTTIDLQASRADPHRAFTFNNQEDSTAILEGFTITNGFAPDYGSGSESRGGAIVCDSSSPEIRNCNFRTNDADRRGGNVFCSSSSTRLIDCSFVGMISEIHVRGSGGGISITNSNVEMIRCDFTRCSASSGGAIGAILSDLKIESCEFTDNEGFGEFSGIGGAIICIGSRLRAIGCTFRGNVGEGGGAIFCESGLDLDLNTSLYLEDCNFVDNAAAWGGAVAYQ